MFKKKSQSSLEFLMIFGIGFTIILILAGIFFSYFNGEKNTLDSKHLDNIGNEIIQNVEKIYFLGSGNRITINTNFPSGIDRIGIRHYENITVNSQQISFDYLEILTITNETLMFNPNEHYVRFNCSECYYDTSLNLSYFNDTSIYSGGNKKIRIESKEDFVDISFVRE